MLKRSNEKKKKTNYKLEGKRVHGIKSRLKKIHVKNKTTIWADAVTAIFDSMFDALVSTLHDFSLTMFFFSNAQIFTHQ